jgi:NADH-quinone oxidoreductase subunit A
VPSEQFGAILSLTRAGSRITPIMSPTAIVAYLALFSIVGFVFLFANLLIGKLVRPVAPNVEKLEVYECGEPTIGSSFVQFDLRFYVIALLFIIFDVEIAFFFPWAVVYGKATHLMDKNFQSVVAAASDDAPVTLTPAATRVFQELGIPKPAVLHPESDAAANTLAIRKSAQRLAVTSIMDILVFFAVLMVGFAYVWRRGDLDWVRAVGEQRSQAIHPLAPKLLERGEEALVAS